VVIKNTGISCYCGSRWLPRPRCGSAVARLLGLRVRIPLGHGSLLWMFASCQVEAATSGWASSSVVVKPRYFGDPGPLGVLRHGGEEKKKQVNCSFFSYCLFTPSSHEVFSNREIFFGVSLCRTFSTAVYS
jgi:hypothetical protein